MLRLIEQPPGGEHGKMGSPKSSKPTPLLDSPDPDVGGTMTDQPATPGAALERVALLRAAESSRRR